MCNYVYCFVKLLFVEKKNIYLFEVLDFEV